LAGLQRRDSAISMRTSGAEVAFQQAAISSLQLAGPGW
jgi:hypothetical protein